MQDFKLLSEMCVHRSLDKGNQRLLSLERWIFYVLSPKLMVCQWLFCLICKILS